MSQQPEWPRWLLTSGNSDLARARGTVAASGLLLSGRIYVWSIPALVAELDGRRIRTCPSAGVCGAACYARFGRYRFRNVRAAHERNLRLALDHGEEWEARLVAELQEDRYRRSWVRIHDAGDFFSEEYALRWCRAAAQAPDVAFYSYSKEVALWKRLMALELVPLNLRIIYSLGGLQDALVDRSRDRFCEVYPSLEALEADGAADQGADDRLAAVGPRHVGIVANSIGTARRRAGERSFGDWQQERAAARAARAAERS